MIPVAEQERLLKKRAQRELERQGYKLFSNKTGGFQIQSALTGKVIAGENYELSVFDIGRFAGVCGFSTTANVEADITSAELARKRMIDRHTRIPDTKDPVTGLPTPEYASVLEQIRK